MSTTALTWRVIRSQQDMARKNARQAMLVIQQRRREQSGSDAVPSPPPQRSLSTRLSSQTGSVDS